MLPISWEIKTDPFKIPDISSSLSYRGRRIHNTKKATSKSRTKPTMKPILEIVAKTEWWDGERKGKGIKLILKLFNQVFALSVRITASPVRRTPGGAALIAGA